jgi:peptide chain release factor 1
MNVAMPASDLDARLADVARQYDVLQGELERPEINSDPGAIRRLGKEMARLEPVVAAFRRLQATRAELAGALELRDAGDGDAEMRSMAEDEITRLSSDETRLLDELKVLLLPRDPNDDRDVIMEIRAGAG